MSSKSVYLKGVAVSAVAVAAIALLTAAKTPPTVFDEITVGRINVREPDGTLRMVISNRAQFPDTPWKGGDIPRPDRRSFAGMLFVNDEGTENGGLIQKGFVGPDGKANAGLSLTFDRFRQDQVIQLLHAEGGGRARSMLVINDESDGTQFDITQRVQRIGEIEKLEPAPRDSAFRTMQDKGQLANNRVLLGTTGDGASALSLADAKGRPRLMLMVTADGKPSVQLLDENGQIAKTIQLDGSSGSTLEPRSPQK